MPVIPFLIDLTRSAAAMAHKQYIRQADSCPEGTAFYKCAVEPFTGCCSTNPCDTGKCGDVDDCDSQSAPGSQGSPAMSEELTTIVTVTVSEAVTSLTTTITISDVITSLVTEAATTTAQQTIPSGANFPPVPTLIPGATLTDSSSNIAASGSQHSAGSTSAEISLTSKHATATTKATTGTTNFGKTTSFLGHTTSSATATSLPPKTPHTSTIVGGIVGGLSLLGLLALLLLLCCCCRRRAKYSFSTKRQTKEDKEEKQRAELLRKAEEATLERQSFPNASVTTGAQGPVRAGGTMEDGGTSLYPRNSTAATPPQHWI